MTREITNKLERMHYRAAQRLVAVGGSERAFVWSFIGADCNKNQSPRMGGLAP